MEVGKKAMLKANLHIPVSYTTTTTIGGQVKVIQITTNRITTNLVLDETGKLGVCSRALCWLASERKGKIL